MNKELMNLVTKISGWLTDSEAKFLEKAVKRTELLAGEIVEIGSFHGKSTICLSQSKGKVYAIDPHEGNVEEDLQLPPSYKAFIKNLKKAKVFHKVTPLVKTSTEASLNWRKRIRMLFIDGLHDEKNAMNDFERWGKHVVNNGIVAVHDSFRHWCGSERMAVKKIVTSDEFYKIGVVDSIIYGVRGQGNFSHRIIKTFWQSYILSMIYLNHVRIILSDVSLIKRKFMPTS